MMSSEVVIAAVGLNSPLGKTFADSLRAYVQSRRGFRRYPEITDPDGRGATLACAFHPFRYEHYDQRLFALLIGAIEDCQSCVEDLASGTALDLGSFPAFVLVPDELKTADSRSSLAALLSASLDRAPTRTIYGDPAAGLSILHELCKQISAGIVPGALLCAVGSFIDPEILDRLYAKGDAFHKSNPYGFIPGEAAVALLLLPRAAEVRPLAEILQIVTSRESYVGQNAFQKRSLIEVLRNLSAAALPRLCVHADLCGPRWRAEEMGAAIVAHGNWLGAAAANVEVAALLTGHLGTADGLCRLALALATPPSDASKEGARCSLIVVMSDVGGRAGVVVRSPWEGSLA